MKNQTEENVREYLGGLGMWQVCEMKPNKQNQWVMLMDFSISK